jgi:hypothetical protein
MIFMKPKFTFFFLLILASSFYFNLLKAQNIYTYAGNGSGNAGYSGNGGNALAALLNVPSSIATHDYENVYIADQANHVIRRVNYQDIISDYAGMDSAGYYGDYGPADSCLMSAPCAVALDGAGNLIIADYMNNVVREVNVSTGDIYTIAGNGTAGYTGDGGAATNATLRYPYGVAVDASGNIYIADAGNNVIREITASGYIQTIIGNGYGSGLALGNGGYSGDGGPANAAELNFPSGIAVDVFGNKYVADAYNNVIRKVGINDSISTFAGVAGVPGYSGDGGYAKAALLKFATGLAVDGIGNVYIADQGNDVVRKVDTGGKIRTIAGTGTAGYSGDSGPAVDAQLSAPKGVAVDGNGLIYIADAGNNAVRIIGNYTGNAVKTVPGNPAGVKIYPNPSAGTFTIALPQAGIDATVTVTDMLGRLVDTRVFNNAQASQSLTVSNIAPGNYIVKIEAGQDTYREKVVVVK